MQIKLINVLNHKHNVIDWTNRREEMYAVTLSHRYTNNIIVEYNNTTDKQTANIRVFS